MDALFEAMADNWFWTVIGGVGLCAVVGGIIQSTIVSASRERTRREIAAYLAEGSLTQEQASMLLKESGEGGSCC